MTQTLYINYVTIFKEMYKDREYIYDCGTLFSAIHLQLGPTGIRSKACFRKYAEATCAGVMGLNSYLAKQIDPQNSFFLTA
jgi:hypothetical protein